MRNLTGRRWRWWMVLAMLTLSPVVATQAQLGNMAQLTPLAKQQADGLAGQPLAWVGDRMTVTESVTHEHELGFGCLPRSVRPRVNERKVILSQR